MLGDFEARIIYKNGYMYSSWPSIEKLQNGDIVIAFCEAARRPIITHLDPTSHNVLVRSQDNGKTWSEFPSQIRSYDFYSMDDPGIMQLSNGDILVNAYRKTCIPAEMSKMPEYEDFKIIKPFPWAVDLLPDQTFIFRSEDNGKTWKKPVQIDVSPHFQSGCTLLPIVELPNGTLLLPCYDEKCEHKGIEPSKAFVIKSKDNGRTWGNISMIAEDEKIGFYEPALLALPGKIIAMLRTHKSGGWYLYQSNSYDNGETWSRAIRTEMWGYPAHLLHLRDGNILCTYGYRRKPFGIRGCISYDSGESWGIKNEIIIRDNFLNANLGYPTSIQFGDGKILTVYYGEDRDGVTCIQGSFYKLRANDTLNTSRKPPRLTA